MTDTASRHSKAQDQYGSSDPRLHHLHCLQQLLAQNLGISNNNNLTNTARRHNKAQSTAKDE
jgi:hypothetical protein